MVRRPCPLRPAELALGLGDRLVIDAGMTLDHQTVRIELPVFVAVRAEPVAVSIMPLIVKPDRNPIAVECQTLMSLYSCSRAQRSEMFRFPPDPAETRHDFASGYRASRQV